MGFLARLTGRAGEKHPSATPVVQFTVSFGDETSTIEVPIESYEQSGGMGSAYRSDERVSGYGRRDRGPASHPDDCWVREGQLVEVGGRSINSGLIYVGQNLPSGTEGWWPEVEPALIDPSLEVAVSPTPASRSGYFLGYEELARPRRAAYLEWLAQGRPVPADPEFLRLFLFGLERRLFFDPAVSASAPEDRVPIVAELRRLLAGCQDEERFTYEGARLLDFLEGQDLLTGHLQAEPPTGRAGWHTPLALRVPFGLLASLGQPLPADWALSWVFSSVESYLRTPATRCPAEFAHLFRIRYQERFGPGLKLPHRAKPIVLDYRTANPGLREVVETSALPDVAEAPKVVKVLRELALGCCSELDAYSRWLGRNPEAADTLPATALLPRPLLETHPSPELRAIRDWLGAQIAGEPPWVVDGEALLEHWSTPGGKLGKKEAVLLMELLAKLGCGCEPDVRFGSPPPVPDAPVALFPLDRDAPVAPSPAFSAAAMLLQLAATIAAADGSVTEEEERHLEAHLEGLPDLLPAERDRLRAHTERLLRSKPGLRGLKKKLGDLSPPQREGVAKSLIAVAAADGSVSREEIKVLTKVYELLELDAADLYSEIHASTTQTPPAAEPVTVREGELSPEGHAIPAEGRLVLDRGKVEAKLEETAMVSSVLAGIFVEEEPEAPPAPAEPSEVAGLDKPQVAFARALAERASWTREEVEGLAAQRGLLPDGSLEALNEAAFELCGGPFCEGEDPVEVNGDASRELLG